MNNRVIKSLAIGCIALLAVACSNRGGPEQAGSVSSGPPRLLAPSELSEQERRFGVSPTHNSQVTYQPGVIIVEDGSQIIRAMGGDGMSWSIDARAAARHDIQPGKVVFLTSRVVGRVLAMKPVDDAVELTLGPVELGDVIRDCDIQFESALDFGQAIVYSHEQMPSEVEEVAPIAWQPAIRPFQLIASTTDEDFRVTGPIASLGTLGGKIHGSKHGTGLDGQAVMHMESPRIGFKLVMSGATVKVAELKVYGGVGFSIGFVAVNRDGSKFNINERVQVPHDLSIPIGGPLPLTVTVRQRFKVQTAFGAPGVLRARADYTYGGVLGVAYHEPYFAFEEPEGFGGRESLINSVQGVSLAVGGLSLTHQVKVIGGFGAFNFVVGPYVYLNSNANVTRNGDTDTLGHCIWTGFNMYIGTGVGYVVPQPVTKVINFFLGALNLKPIEGEGGKEGPASFVKQYFDVWPASAVCTPDSNSTPKGPTAVVG